MKIVEDRQSETYDLVRRIIQIDQMSEEALETMSAEDLGSVRRAMLEALEQDLKDVLCTTVP